MTLTALLIQLRHIRASIDRVGDDLRVEAPQGSLTTELMEALRQYKQDLLLLPRPYINSSGELVIPLNAPPQYHWRRITESLRELDAPPTVWSRYTSAPYESGSETVSLVYPVECHAG